MNINFVRLSYHIRAGICQEKTTTANLQNGGLNKIISLSIKSPQMGIPNWCDPAWCQGPGSFCLIALMGVGCLGSFQRLFCHPRQLHQLQPSSAMLHSARRKRKRKREGHVFLSKDVSQKWHNYFDLHSHGPRFVTMALGDFNMEPSLRKTAIGRKQKWEVTCFFYFA